MPFYVRRPMTTQVEVDFGSSPVRSKSFTINDARVNTGSTVTATQSATPATGRGTDDALWDGITLACVAGAGVITVHAFATGNVAGPRRIAYTIN